ncbi:hypothetical protein PAMP_015568 [Pampus punctatissimus]
MGALGVGVGLLAEQRAKEVTWAPIQLLLLLEALKQEEILHSLGFFMIELPSLNNNADAGKTLHQNASWNIWEHKSTASSCTLRTESTAQIRATP